MIIGGLINEQLSWFGVGFDSEAAYYTPLVDYVDAIADRNVVLTGHSLGGGLARIVGAFTGTVGQRALSGIHLSRSVCSLGFLHTVARPPCCCVFAARNRSNAPQAVLGTTHSPACP